MRGNPRLNNNRKKKGKALVLSLITLVLAAMSITAGALVITSTQTHQIVTEHPAPVVAAPFTAASPDTYKGTKTVEPMGALELSIPADGLDAPAPGSGISIPAEGVRAPIADVGLDSHAAMIIPNAPTIGHYTLAAPLAAKTGSTVLAGHVDYDTGTWSPMAMLPLVKKGAPIYVTDASGTIHKYRVVTAQTLPKVELPVALFAKDGPAQLVLITCGGEVTYAPGSPLPVYSHNTVVTAVPYI